MAIAKKFLDYMGIDPRRVKASWVSASEAGKFTEVVNEMTQEIKELGPNRLFTDERWENGTKTAP